MADVTRVPGLGEQVRLILILRWRLFRNGLSSTSARVGLFASIILATFYGGNAIAIGGAIGVGSFTLAQKGELGYFGAILWGIAAFWQLFPIAAASSGAGFDFRNILRFPLRFSSYFSLTVAHGLFGASALCGLLWHGCLWLGVTAARPGAWWGVTMAVAGSVLVNLLFSSMVDAWVARLLAQRRTREAFLALFIVTMIGLQFARFAVRNAMGPVQAFLHRTSALWNTLPPGQAGAAIRAVLTGSFGNVLLSSAAVAAYAALFAAILAQRLHNEYLGEYFSDGTAPERARRTQRPAVSVEASVEPFRTPTWWRGPVGAVFLKEVRYLVRNSVLATNLLLPVIIGGAFAANRGSLHHVRNSFPATNMYPAVVAYAAFILIPGFSMNSLGFDGAGTQLYVLAPVPFRSIMLGKNLFLSALLAVEAAFVWAIVTLIAGPPPLVSTLQTWTGLAFVALLGMSLGNWFSIQQPRKLNFGIRQRASGLAGLVVLVTYLCCFGLLGAIAAAGTWLIGEWFVPIAYSVLCLVALFVYRAVLDATTDLADKKRETILGQLAR